MSSSDANLEYAIWIVKQSSEVSRARLGALLDGANLAGEQVQDTRIKFIESPPSVSGWSILGQVFFTFLLDSTIAPALLSKFAQLAFTPVIRSHNAWLSLLPKADYYTREIVAKNVNWARQMRFDRLADRIVRSELRKLSSEMDLYHKTLAGLAAGGTATEKNLVAGAKTAREYLRAPTRPHGQDLGGGLSAGNEFLLAMREYASLTFLGISTFELAFERDLRINGCTSADLNLVVDTFGWPDTGQTAASNPLGGIDPRGNTALDLTEIRQLSLITAEAVIWARLYGFSARTGPEYLVNEGSLKGVPSDILHYWKQRFGGLIDSFVVQSRDQAAWYRGSFEKLPPSTQVKFLRQYFMKIVGTLPRLEKGELCPVITAN